MIKSCGDYTCGEPWVRESRDQVWKRPPKQQDHRVQVQASSFPELSVREAVFPSALALAALLSNPQQI